MRPMLRAVDSPSWITLSFPPRLSAAGTSDVVDDKQFKGMNVDVDGGDDGDFGTGWGR